MNKKSISPEPGKRIRQIRKKLGLSRIQFEELTGVSASTLRYLEIGARELFPAKARLLATIFIYRFSLKEEEAGEYFLLNGEQSDNSIEDV
jgi:transcriptional regulator with XRE-family HTH domain